MLDNKRVVLLGVEKIIKLNWFDKRTMTALIWHDTAGIFYHKTNTNGEKLAWQLFTKGMAILVITNKNMLFKQLIKRVKADNITFFKVDIYWTRQKN